MMEFGTSALVGYIVSAGLERLKAASWFPYLTARTASLNRIVSIVLAAGSVAGIQAAYDGGTLTISGLTLSGILTAVIEVGRQWVMQQIIYRVAIEKGIRR
jgi:hypothetical protein